MHPAFTPALSRPIQAKVLVALVDLVDWGRNIRGRTTADVFAELDEFYRMTDHAVEAAGGLVVKYMGDGAFVVFPEGLADQGIMAMLQLKRDVDAWFKGRGVASGLHVNAHFGEVTMGKMGGIDRLDMIGETVNICATLPHRGVTLSPQAFRCLSPENRRQFHRYTPPITYHPEAN